MNTKQVIVIRKDLNMRRGKEIAQASHASMAFITKRIQQNSFTGSIPLSEVEIDWINNNFTKICLQVSSEEELIRIYEAGIKNKIVSNLIIDSGKTEFNGVPTPTCVALGPDISEKIDVVTKDLKLY